MTDPFGMFRPLSYEVIVADPPWDFQLYSSTGNHKSAAAQYRTMPTSEIAAMNVGHLAREDCLLLLWTTGWAMVRGDAARVARAWGFTPITELVWDKRTASGKRRMGPGYRARTMHEPILLATTGYPPHLPFPSAFDGLAREHSRKPDEFYDIVRRHTPRQKRIDLFSRQRHEGFDAWGDERGKFDVVAVAGDRVVSPAREQDHGTVSQNRA